MQTTPAFANFGREPASASSLRRELEGEVELVPFEIQDWISRMERLVNLRKALSQALKEASNRQAHYYNLRHRAADFKVGDLVLRRRHVLSNAAKRISAALEPPYEGPYLIHKKLSQVRYQLIDLRGKIVGVSAIEDLKPYKPPLPEE